MELVTAEEYALMDRPGLEWVLPGYIPTPSLVMLLGEPKVGKSFLALQLAFAIAHGTTFLGKEPKQGPVLYLQFDTSETVWRERLRDMRKYQDISGPMIMVHPDHNLQGVDIRKIKIREWWREAIEKAKPVLIIVDVLREVHDANENDSTEMKVVGDFLISMLKNKAALILHHTPKLRAAKDDDGEPVPIRPVNTARGSSYLTGKVDAFWLLHENQLWVTSRFSESFNTLAERQTTGIWKFPYLDIGGKLIALCHEFPTLTHSQISEIAVERYGQTHGITKANYYRWLASVQCPHTQITTPVTSPVTALLPSPHTPALDPPQTPFLHAPAATPLKSLLSNPPPDTEDAAR